MQQEDTARLIEDWTQTHGRTRDRLLPLLHMLQEEIRFIDGSAIKIIAENVNLTPADVHAVVTSSHGFRRSPAGRRFVKFCRAESGQAQSHHAKETEAAERTTR